MSKNVNNLHDELLAKISDSYQKTEGFPLWDILKAVAFGLYNLWVKVFEIEAKQNVDNLTGSELERFVSQRKGITRKGATYAVGTVTVTGEGAIAVGDLFSTKGGIQFTSLEDKTVNGTAVIEVVCASLGEVGNVPVEAICEMPVTVQGISSVINTEPTVDGYEAESDDSLRERYYEALREPATSGNIYHYKRWAREVSGVGSVKVFPLWQGDNTVEVVIIDDNALVPEQELVDRVQEYIDPNKAGTGMGQAPIGAYCTVTPATALPIDIKATLILDNTVGVAEIKVELENSVTKYLADIALDTEYISPAKIGNLILKCEGVVDYDNLTVNGSNNRVDVPEKSVAILGSVVLNVE